MIGEIGEEFFILLEGQATVWKPITKEMFFTSSDAKAYKLDSGPEVMSIKEIEKETGEGEDNKSKFQVVILTNITKLQQGAGFGEVAISKNVPRYQYIYI